MTREEMLDELSYHGCVRGVVTDDSEEVQGLFHWNISDEEGPNVLTVTFTEHGSETAHKHSWMLVPVVEVVEVIE